MTNIIDRRGEGGKSNINVDRVARRFRKYVRAAAKRALEKAGITGDIQKEKVDIPPEDLSEPTFAHAASGGVKHIVQPGNDRFYKGDTIDRPKGGAGGSGNGSGNGDGNGQDDFVLQLDSKEIQNILFDELALPLSMREHVASDRVKFRRAGVVSTGTSNNLLVKKTFEAAIGRRMAQNGHTKKRLEELMQQFEAATDENVRAELTPEIERLKKRKAPFLDTMDQEYRNRVPQPVMESRAVMFAPMDVSGSMTDDAKYRSRLYYMFLYRFLKRHYERVELVMIRYHDKARVCEDENDFFHGKDSGGTSVFNALELIKQQVSEKYNPNEWDIFCAQAGDGDLGLKEDYKVKTALNDIMAYCRYFTNLVIAPPDKQKELQVLYKALEPQYGGRLATRQTWDTKDILPVFREMFKNKTGVHLARMGEEHRLHSFALPAAAP